jgi:hypothetical protein
MLTLILLWMAAGAEAPQAAPPPSRDAQLRQLLAVRRVYVDRMTGGETAAQMREILISSLEETGLFVVTENQERADTFLRGGAEDLVFTESHSSSDSLNIHTNASARTDTFAGSGSRNATSTREGRGFSAGIGAGESESQHSTDRRHEAIAAVRLVNKDGDVIWATTQESLGAKFRGASADVADKITAKLREDFERARKLAENR